MHFTRRRELAHGLGRCTGRRWQSVAQAAEFGINQHPSKWPIYQQSSADSGRPGSLGGRRSAATFQWAQPDKVARAAGDGDDHMISAASCDVS